MLDNLSSRKNGCSGWTTHYYSWRMMQGFLCVVGLIAFTTIYFLFPETSQPGARGIDKMKARNEIDSSKSFIFINPLESLWLLRSPIMLSIVSVLEWYCRKRPAITSTEYHINLNHDIHIWWGSWSNLEDASYLLSLFPIALLVPLAYTMVNACFFTTFAIEFIIYS